MFVYLEKGLLREDGSINAELVCYLTNYHVDFTLVTEKLKTSLNQWDVSQVVKEAGLPQEVAGNCLFGASVDVILQLGQPKDIVFTDCEHIAYCLGDIFRMMNTQELTACVV